MGGGGQSRGPAASVAPAGRLRIMKLLAIVLVVCACACVSADVAHLQAKAKGRWKARQHKRGVLSAVPPYKLGHDIPLVTHSLVKPLVVTYPPTATVAAVKVPLPGAHYPVGVGHRVPVPHPHYGLKFPHTKVVVPRPDHHYHHHHHHVAPKPVVPVPPSAPLPVPRPAAPVVHPVAPPPPPVFLPTPVAPAPPPPLATIFQSHPVPLPPPPAPLLPPSHLHLRPLLQASAVPLPTAQGFSSPFGVNQIPYVIRPGGAVHTSVFATYPRYPFLNFQAPFVPSIAAGQGVQQVLLDRPPPQFHYLPQAVHGGFEHTPHAAVDPTPAIAHPTNIVPPSVIPLNPPHELPQPGVHVHPTQAVFPQHEIPLHPTQSAIPQPSVHLQPTQPSVHLDHDGWSPVPAQHDLAGQGPAAHFPQQGFTQEQGTQVYEHHTEDQYHDLQHQLQHHIQQQIEQAQYEQHLNNQHQLNQAGFPSQQGQDFPPHGQDFGYQGQEFGHQGQNFGHQGHQGQDFGHQGQDFGHQGQDFGHQGQDFGHQGYQGQDFGHQGQDFGHQGQDFGHQGQSFGHQGQDFGYQGQDVEHQGQQDFTQNDYSLGQPGQEYGVPQGVEGRSGDQGDQAGQGEQLFHNHIPLGLQPPMDRPLDHFR